MSLLSTRLRTLFGLSASALLLTLGACQHDSDPEDPTPADPNNPGNFVTTPYNLIIPVGFPTPQIPADNPLTNEGVQLGRMLFYETKLSSDNSLSCGSCHQQSKAFTDGLKLAVGVNGAKHQRNTMPLGNIIWSKTLTWDGSSTTLEKQARVPIENPIEMHQSLADGVRKLQATSTPDYPSLFQKAFGTRTITEDLVLKALAQFERTLISANSRFDRDTTRFTTDEKMGMKLFKADPIISGRPPYVRGANCWHCHNQPLFTARDFFNNGLDPTFADKGRGGVTMNPADDGKFQAPSLRNVALTAPYMHDGRFNTLEEVLDHYSDHINMRSPNLDVNIATASNNPLSGQLALTATEKRQVIAFLKTLTDSTFIQDKRFSDPFHQ